MNHQYIDEFLVAERYVENALPPDERAAFEAHLVDCQECTDRLILAGMFHMRNGFLSAAAPPRTGMVVRLRLWQIVLICAIAVVLLLAFPTILIPLWKLLSK